jgi:sigma-B regulation protein RsbU (phosphoserine phosphatase)
MPLRDDIGRIIEGTVFVLPGLACCGIAAMRRGSGARAVMWVGVWSAMYGARPLGDALGRLGVMPKWFEASLPYMDTVTNYLVIVVASLATMELCKGRLRSWVRRVMFVGMAVAVAGIGLFVWTGTRNNVLIVCNEIVATCLLSILFVVVAIRKLSRQFFVFPPGDSRVLKFGTLIFAAEALCVNVVRPFGYRISPVFDGVGFAILLTSFGYVALQMMFTNERRLLSIENELAIAREIQNSILPGGNPQMENLQITSAYRPMTAVAGDFYEFVRIDENRIGFLVADVSGHGVPAALIGAMIKVAMQSVGAFADKPGEVLHELNRILSEQLREQFVTAAYLVLDTRGRKALYSAAGHPPLLRWRNGKLERIESNGIVIGMITEPEYPVREMVIEAGDRFVLYTDGVVEPENARGEAFGDKRLEEVIRQAKSGPSELVEEILQEIGKWRPAGMSQQDDITLIVVDVV